MSKDGVTMEQGCDSASRKTFRWEEIRYIVFNDKCAGAAAPGDGVGHNDDAGTCASPQRFLRIDFNHASDEPFIYAKSIVAADANSIRMETVQNGVVTGPRTRLKSVAPVLRCGDDPLLKKGSLPREYH
jgi:hypothetical protein